MQTHRFNSPSNQLHALCTVDGCKGSRTDAIHVVSEDIAVTVWKSPGVGYPVTFQTRGEFLNFALESIANNIPFTVGHTFGNIDGTHPKRELVLLPEPQKTRVITFGELKPDSIIIEASRAFKVGQVRHTEDGYTYYSLRAITGPEYSADNLCSLSIAGVTVETR